MYASGGANDGARAMPSVSAIVPTAAGLSTPFRAPRRSSRIQICSRSRSFDQSDDRKTEEALATIRDPRLRYVRSDLRGVTEWPHLGMEVSKGDILSFTDDDLPGCADWIAATAKLYADDPEAAVVRRSCRVPKIFKSAASQLDSNQGSRVAGALSADGQ